MLLQVKTEGIFSDSDFENRQPPRMEAQLEQSLREIKSISEVLLRSVDSRPGSDTTNTTFTLKKIRAKEKFRAKVSLAVTTMLDAATEYRMYYLRKIPKNLAKPHR